MAEIHPEDEEISAYGSRVLNNSDVPQGKRRRAETKSTSEQACDSGVTRRLINIPVEIFAEIASHLLPVDIISLSRSTKFYRNLLMNRSSRRIWTDAMKNVEGLPPCPSDMSEPSYFALLFSPYCTICGQTDDCNFYSILRVRLCWPCRARCLTPVYKLPTIMEKRVHQQWITEFRYDPKTGNTGYYGTLEKEAIDIFGEFTELQMFGDQAALAAWEKARVEAVKKREKEAAAIDRFLGLATDCQVLFELLLQSLDEESVNACFMT